ncbi:ABC transporter substrate-binding protein [Marinobacterium zhoushanense]|uniref:ABC transporter substrate-binding protein n=1 Tax=Marinobacterium zhoushanense TaxID=1679163 RepID=A0ABQ1K7P8_9GAMM|nr:TRAP transporter substrate-binding protein [Marinobacterium zhoushanense]GGB87053.1 ABC transporter substrate-binding protein [Marinobacterium zhoushanense]
MKMIKHAACGALAMLVSTSALADAYKMKIGIATRNDPIHHYAEELAKRLNERSDGQINAKVFPGGQLGNIPRMIENLQFGAIEVVVAPPLFAKGLSDRFEVAAAPGLFRDIDHAYATLQDADFRDDYLSLADKNGVTGIGLWVYGGSSYASKKPIVKLTDFNGMKIRSIGSDLEDKELKLLGASAVPMPFIEMVPGLQNNAIDGVRSSILAMGAMKMQTVADHLTITGEIQYPIAAFASKGFLNKLPDELEQLVLDTSRELDKEMQAHVIEKNSLALNAWTTEGVTVHQLDAADSQQLLENGKTATTEVFAAKPESLALYQKLVEISNKY